MQKKFSENKVKYQGGWAALLGLAAIGTLAMSFSIMFMMGQMGSSRISYYGDIIQLRYAAESGIEIVSENIINNPELCQSVSSNKISTMLSESLMGMPVKVYATKVTELNVEKVKLLSISGTQDKIVEVRRYIIYDSSANTVSLDRWE